MSDTNVSQHHVSAGRDNIVADQIIFNAASRPASPVTALMERLAQEIANNSQVQDLIDTLQFFQVRHVHDGIVGLEGKLRHANRANEVLLALRQKELFSRLLAKHSMFDSAQQIFAYLLAKIEHDYKCYILPNVGIVTPAEIDHLINEHLVTPCVAEVGAGVFSLNAHIAMGMIYWLAEQCYIRWHS